MYKTLPVHVVLPKERNIFQSEKIHESLQLFPKVSKYILFLHRNVLPLVLHVYVNQESKKRWSKKFIICPFDLFSRFSFATSFNLNCFELVNRVNGWNNLSQAFIISHCSKLHCFKRVIWNCPLRIFRGYIFEVYRYLQSKKLLV